MKTRLYNFIYWLALPLFLTGCASNEEFAMIDTKSENTKITVVSSDNSAVLTEDNAALEAFTITWNKPDYGVVTETPNYQIFIAKENDNFSEMIIAASTNTEEKTFMVEEINKVLINNEIATDAVANIQFKVVATTGDLVTESSPITIAITPYSKSSDPIFMIGAALMGWDTAKAVEVPATGSKTFETVALFTNGESFRFFDAADWGANSYNHPHFSGGTITSLLENAGDGDSNFLFNGATGYYKIGVNLKTLTVTMEATELPDLFMVGAAVPDAGWGWSTPVKLTWIKHGLFEVTTTFANDAFRFFTKNGDWGSGRNYPYYQDAEYSIDANFENAEDGDKNFKFIGTPGEYTITVNTIAKTISLSN
ncbi:SusE domain-containing protein [Flavicella marina]|uniref:SusE domain-containing protein n=1 Tax=Flavicella marina TaxID=1475951 RepID=UPI001264610F|nr:SusE domain-containing protein [Flavicella marina]